MPNPFDDIGFHAKDGAQFGMKVVLIPFGIIVVLSLALAGILYGFNSRTVPTGPPDLSDPEVVGQEITTDMYGNALLSAFSCVRDFPDTSCDQDGVKSDLVIAATEEILIVNEKKIPITDKDELHEALNKEPFTNINFTAMTTESKGKKIDDITYTNKDEQQIIFHFDKNDDGEVVLKSMEVTK